MMKRQFALLIIIGMAFAGFLRYRQVRDALPKVDNKAPEIRPIDANNDGTIDDSDVLVLMKQANIYYYENIRPLLKKTGIEIDEETGKIMGTSDESRNLLKKNLSSAERRELTEAVKQHQILLARVEATARYVMPNIASHLPHLWSASLPLALSHGGMKGGLVYEDTGKPAEGIELALAKAIIVKGKLTALEFQGRHALTDSSGEFQFAQVPPGKYVLVVAGMKPMEEVVMNEKQGLIYEVKAGEVTDFGKLRVKNRPEAKYLGKSAMIGEFRFDIPISLKDNKTE